MDGDVLPMVSTMPVNIMARMQRDGFMVVVIVESWL